jgi:hypothetical protein
VFSSILAAFLLLGTHATSQDIPAPEAPGVPPFERVIAALARIDLHLLDDYGFSVQSWPKLQVVQWPVVSVCLPPSDLSTSFAAMEGALNRGDIPSALREAEDLAALVGDAGLGGPAIEMAKSVARYAERQGDGEGRARMSAFIQETSSRLGVALEYSAEGVPIWFLALKPRTLFVGSEENVRKLGLAGIQSRFANMLDVVAQDMSHRPDLTSCTWHPRTPDHLVRDFWIAVQRLRMDAASLSCALARGEAASAVKQVPYFNASWGFARGMTLGTGCPVVGILPTWR